MTDPNPIPQPGSDEAIRQSIADARAAKAAAPPDPGGYFQSVAEARAVIARGVQDPTSVYFGRDDILAGFEANAARVAARHNIVPPPVLSPQEVADREREESWQRALRVPPAFQEMLNREMEAEKALSPQDRERNRQEIIDQVGAAQYLAMVDLAKSAVEPAEWSDAITSNMHLLRVLSHRGQMLARRAAEAKGRNR